MFRQNSILKKALPYLFFSALATVTFLLLMEVTSSQATFPHADKVVHMILFLGLSSMGALAFPKHRSHVFLGLAFYGVLTEILQHLITVTRHASFLDWISDVVGILLCISVIRLLGQTKPT